MKYKRQIMLIGWKPAESIEANKSGIDEYFKQYKTKCSSNLSCENEKSAQRLIDQTSADSLKKFDKMIQVETLIEK